MHLVEFDLEAGDAGAFALAYFHVDEESAAVVVERTQFVEFGVVARRDGAAVADLRGRLGGDGADQQVERRCRRLHFEAKMLQQRRSLFGERCTQRRQAGQRIAQAG